MNINGIAIAVALAALAGSATADITINHGSSAGSYGTQLNFDEVGGPTGVVDPVAWAAIGVTELQAGDGQPIVDDHDSFNGGWGLGSGNSFFGNFGVFMTFSDDVTEFSTQVWDPSGPPTLFGGGLGVFVFNDGVEVTSSFSQGLEITPAWGGIGDTWIDITTTNGMVFDEVRILGFGFSPTTYVDDMSWNMVPAPGSLAIVGMSLLGIRRRRSA